MECCVWPVCYFQFSIIVNAHLHFCAWQYIVSFECTTSDDYTSTAEMSLTVNAAPNSQAEAPQCVASPATAKPVIGKFSFECLQFSDVDTPLWYQFGFTLADEQDVSGHVDTCVYEHAFLKCIQLFKLP
jgi:hypothetical protein